MKEQVINILEWIACIIVAVTVALLIRYYIGTPTIVKQTSMFPTLKQDQRLILNRWGRTTKTLPKRGEIITFESPSTINIDKKEADMSNPIAKYEINYTGFSGFVYHVLEFTKMSYIKRVIGLPGEHIKIENGKVYINEQELEEPYLQEGVVTDSDRTFVDFIVPQNCVFVMGDNRGKDENGNAKSIDSRNFGCIPLGKIEGKVVLRIWPLGEFGKVK